MGYLEEPGRYNTRLVAAEVSSIDSIFLDPREFGAAAR